MGVVTTGFMVFSAEPPLIGLSYHPAWAPSEPASVSGSQQWAAAYGVTVDKGKLLQEVKEDFVEATEAYQRGDLEDAPDEPDMIRLVNVHDDGRIEVLEEGRVAASYLPDEVYGAFGMTPPDNAPGPEADAWSLISKQIEGLSRIMRHAGINAITSEYRFEDGIAGLQDVRVLDATGLSVPDFGPEGRGIPLPGLVSVTSDGDVTTTPLSGTGDMRDVSDAILTSVAELVVNTSDHPVDVVRMKISDDGGITVGVEQAVETCWTPPSLPSEPEEGPQP